MSRSLAAKAALATRVDAFGDEVTFDLGTEHKVKLEQRLRMLEEGNLRKLSGTGKVKSQFEKYHVKSEIKTYQAADDSTIHSDTKKRRHSEVDTPKKLIEEIKEEEEEVVVKSEKKKKKKKESISEDYQVAKKVKTEDEEDADASTSEKKKKKKKVKEEVEDVEIETPKSDKKKKKKKVKQEEDDD